MNGHEINRAFEAFKQMNILVIGDVMIDAYVWGKVSRISPEAPVPIVNIQKKEYRLGGAANVALNLKQLGSNPIICSVVGNDHEAQVFSDLLQKRKITDKGIISEANRQTTIKTRVIGSSQQLIRIDEEIKNPINDKTALLLTVKIEEMISSQQINGIIFEDYDKGLLSESTITKIIDIARKNNIFTAVDPKKKNFFNYKNVSLFKPNFKELNEGLKLELSATAFEEIHNAAQLFCQAQTIEQLVITLSEYGILVSEKGKFALIPAEKRDIADVSGAGDTVISVLTLCKSFGLSTVDSARLANLAGGLVCEKIGVVPIDRNELLDEALAVFS